MVSDRRSRVRKAANIPATEYFLSRVDCAPCRGAKKQYFENGGRRGVPPHPAGPRSGESGRPPPEGTNSLSPSPHVTVPRQQASSAQWLQPWLSPHWRSNDILITVKNDEDIDYVLERDYAEEQASTESIVYVLLASLRAGRHSVAAMASASRRW